MKLVTAIQLYQLNQNFTKNDILKKYKELALKFHPDKYYKNNKFFIFIKQARDLLLENLKTPSIESNNVVDTYHSLIKTNDTELDENIKILGEKIANLFNYQV